MCIWLISVAFINVVRVRVSEWRILVSPLRQGAMASNTTENAPRGEERDPAANGAAKRRSKSRLRKVQRDSRDREQPSYTALYHFIRVFKRGCR